MRGLQTASNSSVRVEQSRDTCPQIVEPNICFAEPQATLLFRARSSPYLHTVRDNGERTQAMALVKNDLYRNLGLGFLLGALGAVLANPALTQAVTALV